MEAPKGPLQKSGLCCFLGKQTVKITDTLHIKLSQTFLEIKKHCYKKV